MIGAVYGSDVPFRVLPAGPPHAGAFTPGGPTGPAVTLEVRGAADAADEEAVILVSRGQVPTGGYSIAVTAVRREGPVLKVICRLHDPAPGAMVTMALTVPRARIAVPRAALPPPGGHIVAVTTDNRILAKCNVY